MCQSSRSVGASSGDNQVWDRERQMLKRRTVAFGHGELNPSVLGQVPLPILASRALRGKTCSAQRLDVEVAIEVSGVGRTVQVALN